MPPFELIPTVATQLPPAFFSLVAGIAPAHNTALTTAIKNLASSTGATIYIGDLNKLVTYIATPAGMDMWGFSNVKDACYNRTTKSVCDKPDKYLFWDNLHPTTKAHALLAQVVLDEVNAVDDLATIGVSGTSGTTVATATVGQTSATSTNPPKSGAVGRFGGLLERNVGMVLALVGCVVGLLII
ncbi:hypothetical protein HDU76_005083 [Blyttiomyces sp. JEL0837]|nr:hypothetical protein HDU76_005083 [Blyttiomyces sp. JEL0837]